MNDFKKLFMSTAPYHHRYRVWNDFITMSGIALHNSIPSQYDQELEDRYLKIVASYEREDVFNMKSLFQMLPTIFEKDIDDYLGKLYMELEISNDHLGQYFTPFNLSLLTAKLTFDDSEIKQSGYVTLHEPSIGSGGMVLAFAKTMMENGYNYQKELYVHGIDIDETVAWMSYIQLSLYGIAAEINIGNTLTLEIRRKMVTPMHVIKQWNKKEQSYYGSIKDINNYREKMGTVSLAVA